STWDVVTLQPSFNTIEGPTGDQQRIDDFSTMLTRNLANMNTQLYVYERWPWNDALMTAEGYAELWDTPYAGIADGRTSTRDFYEKLWSAVSSTVSLNKPVGVIPTGEVFYNLNAAILAGKVPELTSITDLYRDFTHLSQIGSYTLATTFYAT